MGVVQERPTPKCYQNSTNSLVVTKNSYLKAADGYKENQKKGYKTVLTYWQPGCSVVTSAEQFHKEKQTNKQRVRMSDGLFGFYIRW